MTLSKTSVQPLDLDDLERQLREVAVSSLPKGSEDPLAELARIVGRDNAPRAVPGQAQSSGAFRLGVQPNSGRSARAEHLNDEDETYDLEASIQAALREDPAYDSADEHVEEALEDVEPEIEDALATEDEAHSGSEEWDEDSYADEPAYAGEAGRFDEVEDVPAIPEDEASDLPARRRLVSPRALALALPLLLIGVGVGAAVVMRSGPMSRSSGEAPMIKADDTPVKVLPAKAAGDQQTPSETALGAADPSGKPSQVVLADAEQPVDVVAAAKSAPPRDLGVSQPPAGSGIVILSGSGAGNASGSASAPADSSAGSANAPATQPLPTAAANVPLPEPPQPAAQASIFGTPHRVSTVSVKPDGTGVSNSKAKLDIRANEAKTDVKSEATPASVKAPLTMASAETTPLPSLASVVPSATPAAKKPADTTRAKPSAVTTADDQQVADQSSSQQSVKPAKPVAKTAKAKPVETASAAQDGGAGAPLSITPPGNRGHAAPAKTVVANAEPAKTEPAANTSGAAATASTSGSFAVQLASSTSESDARATLSRLQKQFPNELGGGAIHRADLGSKGVFYRVRVGPLSREAADKICTQLKAGGAECILTRG